MDFTSGEYFLSIGLAVAIPRQREISCFAVVSETWLKQVAYSVQDRTKMPPKDDCAKSKPQPIDWTENHDLLLMREMLISDLFLYKKGSTNRGLVWDP